MAEASFYTVKNTAPGPRFVVGANGMAVTIEPGQTHHEPIQVDEANVKGAKALGLEFSKASARQAREGAEDGEGVEHPGPDGNPTRARTEADPVQTAPVRLTAADLGQTRDATDPSAPLGDPDRIVHEGFGRYRAYSGDSPVGTVMNKEAATKLAAERGLDVGQAKDGDKE